MKKTLPVFVICLIVLSFMLACTPNIAAPPLVPAATATPSTVAVPKPAIPSVSTTDAEWAKVLEAAKKEGKVTLYTFFSPPEPRQ